MDLDNFSNKEYKIKDGIPRFVESENFTSSFGLQWNQFQKTQLDSYTNTTMSEDRVRTGSTNAIRVNQRIKNYRSWLWSR